MKKGFLDMRGNCRMVNGAPSGCFDSYVFAYAWLLGWCFTSSLQKQPPDCLDISKGQGILAYNLAIHGLWPNYEVDSQGNSHCPTYCYNSSWGCKAGDEACILQAAAVQGATLAHYKVLVPSWLIMHEWQKHGTCSGKNQNEYIKETLKETKNIVENRDAGVEEIIAAIQRDEELTECLNSIQSCAVKIKNAIKVVLENKQLDPNRDSQLLYDVAFI